MKRFVSLVLAAALLTACGGGDREHILKVYNWSTYIDETVLDDFEQWYKEQTGEDVRIIYSTFDINETMLSKIEKGHEDYDLVCPSDYIIERMLQNDLLLPLDKDFGSTPNYIDVNLAPFIRDAFGLIDGKGKDANDYGVAYMWGTTGILYNTKYVDEEDTHTWDVLRNPKYYEKVFVKDAARDVYSPILMYLKRDSLATGAVTLEQLAYDSSDESLDAVEKYMREVGEHVAGWEADFGKEQMTQEHGWLNMTWSGDAMWAIFEAAEVGVDLKFTVPQEGSNYWFDGWVIPKFARNVKAANYFINYMCRTDIAIRNVDVTGYVSAMGDPEILEAQIDEECDPVDLTYFFGPGYDSVRVNEVLYPDRSVIDRCTLMHDWGDDSAKLVAMWSRVKGASANAFTIVLLAVFILGLLALGIYNKFLSRRARARRRMRSRKTRTWNK